jgi:hypothetical protein
MHHGIYEENLNADAGVAKVAVPPQHPDKLSTRLILLTSQKLSIAFVTEF